MSAATTSRWSRRYVLAGLAFLLCWQAATLAGATRSVAVALALYGFVLHVVFGKAYALLPTYFDRDLAPGWAPAAQWPLSVAGAATLAVGRAGHGPPWLDAAGATLWGTGVLLFVGALAYTVRDNLSGRATGTGAANADRRVVDRAANLGMPVALGYLLAGAYATLAAATRLPPLVDGYPPRATHLLAAGAAALLVFAVGFRLLPRFLVAHPPRGLVGVVLPAGATAPALLAAGLPAGSTLRAGAALEAVAVLGFAVAVVVLFARSESRRVALYGPLAGALAGVAGVGLGAHAAFGGTLPGFARAHLRVNLLGFLGLTVVGLLYQFYPPAVGSFPGAADAGALATLATLAAAVAFQAGGLLTGVPAATTAGEAAGVLGAAGALYLVGGLFAERHGLP